MSPTTVGVYDEAAASAILAPISHFMSGCQYASVVLDTFFAGVFNMMVLQYFLYQRGDKTWIKLLVAYLCSMNWVITVYYWIYISYLLVSNFGKWLPWLEVGWLANVPIFDVMVVGVVQTFFAYRAFLLNRRNWYLFVFIMLQVVAAAIGGLGVKVIFGAQESLLDASASGAWLIIWLSCTTSADVCIAVAILYALLRHKSGWAATDRLVTRLIRMTFEAQLLPTILALAYLIEWTQTPSSLLGAVFQCLQVKAYSIGLLFTLNARVSYKAEYTKDEEARGGQVYGMSKVSSGASRPAQTHIEVHIEETTWVDGHNVPFKSETITETGSDGDLDYEDKHRTPTIGSTTRLTSPGDRAFV